VGIWIRVLLSLLQLDRLGADPRIHGMGRVLRSGHVHLDAFVVGIGHRLLLCFAVLHFIKDQGRAAPPLFAFDLFQAVMCYVDGHGVGYIDMESEGGERYQRTAICFPL